MSARVSVTRLRAAADELKAAGGAAPCWSPESWERLAVQLDVAAQELALRDDAIREYAEARSAWEKARFNPDDSAELARFHAATAALLYIAVGSGA